MADDNQKCAHCGGKLELQFVSIAWPRRPGEFEPQHWEGWLHPECETDMVRRLEGAGARG